MRAPHLTSEFRNSILLIFTLLAITLLVLDKGSPSHFIVCLDAADMSSEFHNTGCKALVADVASDRIGTFMIARQHYKL